MNYTVLNYSTVVRVCIQNLSRYMRPTVYCHCQMPFFLLSREVYLGRDTTHLFVVAVGEKSDCNKA